MPVMGFELKNSSNQAGKTHTLDHAATVIGQVLFETFISSIPGALKLEFLFPSPLTSYKEV